MTDALRSTYTRRDSASGPPGPRRRRKRPKREKSSSFACREKKVRRLDPATSLCRIFSDFVEQGNYPVLEVEPDESAKMTTVTTIACLQTVTKKPQIKPTHYAKEPGIREEESNEAPAYLSAIMSRLLEQVFDDDEENEEQAPVKLTSKSSRVDRIWLAEENSSSSGDESEHHQEGVRLTSKSSRVDRLVVEKEEEQIDAKSAIELESFDVMPTPQSSAHNDYRDYPPPPAYYYFFSSGGSADDDSSGDPDFEPEPQPKLGRRQRRPRPRDLAGLSSSPHLGRVQKRKFSRRKLHR